MALSGTDTTHAEPDAPSPGRLFALGGVVLVLGAMAAIYLGYGKGPWFDEYWSLYAADHDIPLGELVRRRWLGDIHPPLFSVLLWLMRAIGDLDIRLFRLLNVAGYGAAALTLAFTGRRHPSLRPFLFTMVLLTVGTSYFLAQAVELRAASLLIAANLVVVTTFRLWLSPEGDRATVGTWIAYATATVVALNLHYVGTLIGAVMQGVLVLAVVYRRRWRAAAGAAAIVALALVPLVGWYVAQHQLIARTSAHFWVQSSTRDAIRQVALLGWSVITANVLVAVLAVRRAWRHRSLAVSPPSDRSFVLAVMVGLAVTIAVLLVANQHRPLLLPRYLSALVPFALALLAALASEDMVRRRSTAFAAVGVAAATLAMHVLRTPLEPDWDGSSRLIAQAAARCPDTAVHTLFYWQADPSHIQQLADEPTAIAHFYGKAARDWGFQVEPMGGRRRSATCPTVVWVEHNREHVLPPSELARRAGLTVSADEIGRAQLFRPARGLVLIIPPSRRR